MIKFFLPDSKDLVDPGYDFSTDTYHHKRNAVVEHDVYAHEIYGRPNFDGLLVTKSNIDSGLEKNIMEMGGIHKYFRLHKKYLIMGDCGAFQFIKQKVPPYTCEEICDYYNKLGFDLGITLDHLILDFDSKYDDGNSLFPFEPSPKMEYRYRLTLNNAKKILEITKRKRLSFKPIGSVQGWSPKSYHKAVKELVNCGFDYIALGGLARASNEALISVLREIRQTVNRNNVKVHVLGVARLNILDTYMESNVVSCDSASTIMQAFKSDKENYHTAKKNYTAIRIPSVYGDMSPKVRKLLKPFKEAGDFNNMKKFQDHLGRLEKKSLKAVRAYAKKEISLKKAMKTLINYEDEFVDDKKYYGLFEETLLDRPWENCPCVICKKLGVEVIIMRGNNRNRRRGFHNTYIFYSQFKKKTSIKSDCLKMKY